MITKNYYLVSSFWKEHRVKFYLLIILSLVSALVSLGFPYLLKLIIDSIKTQITTPSFFNYIIFLAVLGFLRTGLEVTLPFVRGRTNEQFQQETRSRIYSHLVKLGFSFINKYSTGDIIERLDQDLSELSWFACSGIFRPIEGIFTITLVLVILIKLNARLTIITVLPTTLVVFLWIKFGPVVYLLYRRWREKISETHSFLEASFSGIKIIKSYTAENYCKNEFNQILSERLRSALGVIKADARIQIVFSSVAEISILLILWTGGFLLIKERLTIGSFVAFYAYLLMLLVPMFDLGNFFIISKRARAQEERLSTILNTAPDIQEISQIVHRYKKPTVINFKDEIFLSQVSYIYPESKRYAIRDLSLKISCGQKIGMAGTVGSGKTTLVRLLLRVIDPQRGTISIDGMPYSQLPLNELRALFGYAPQETTLFSDTIYNNLVLGYKNPVSDAELKKILQICQLEEDLSNFQDGLFQKLGSQGITLSGGQKQKVALARALLKKPQILILDDATSNLDAQTEQKIIYELINQESIKTFIIISHRLSVLALCDIIYCLDNGTIVEYGRHEELLLKKGLYFKLYERQLLEEELSILR
jgi:ATP-binding cassette subfamily B protein